MDVQPSIKMPILLMSFRASGWHVRPMQDRIALQSKLLDAAIAQRNQPRWRKLSKRDWEEMFDPCSYREPVYAWLLANHAKVIRARQHRNGWNGLQWCEIARIMVMDNVVGSRGEPPNANSVRRVWTRVCKDKADREARKAKDAS